jgi:plastocyanin
MKRRKFVERLGVGSASLLAAPALVGVAAASPGRRGKPGKPLSTAVVSFGSWRTEAPLDRFPDAAPFTANAHEVIPFHTKIKAGGTVNFVIAGLHQVIIYGPGTGPEDINASSTTPSTGTPAGVPLIDDPANRVYRGPDPSLYPRDRVEAVEFEAPGRYLVICGVLGHFGEEMFGYIDVLPPDRDDDDD